MSHLSLAIVLFVLVVITVGLIAIAVLAYRGLAEATRLARGDWPTDGPSERDRPTS